MVEQKNTLIVDSGIFVALASKTDSYHKKILSVIKALDDRDLWITTWPVVTECCYLLGRDSFESVELFLDFYQQGYFEIFNLTKHHIIRMKELMRQYSDHPMDLADASLIILAEHLEHGNILSIDQRHFESYRWGKNRRFENRVS